MNGTRPTAKNRLISLGMISGAHGVKGEVKLRSYTAIPEDIVAYGPLADKTGTRYSVHLKGSLKDALIAAIDGVHSREQAEALRNISLYVPRSALPAPCNNEYYHEDLIGLQVRTADHAPYGAIVAVHNFGAGDLLSIRRESGEEEMLPFRTALFPEIDFDGGVVTLVPPDKAPSE